MNALRAISSCCCSNADMAKSSQSLVVTPRHATSNASLKNNKIYLVRKVILYFFYHTCAFSSPNIASWVRNEALQVKTPKGHLNKIY